MPLLNGMLYLRRLDLIDQHVPVRPDQVKVTMPTTPLTEIRQTAWRTQILELLSDAFGLTTFRVCLSFGG